jgi:hypothetical protein
MKRFCLCHQTFYAPIVKGNSQKNCCCFDAKYQINKNVSLRRKKKNKKKREKNSFVDLYPQTLVSSGQARCDAG